MADMTISEQILYSAIKLTSYKNGAIISTGTGFTFGFEHKGDESVLCIVTNKHVVQNADQIRARFHLGENDAPTGEFAICNFDVSNGIPYWHPDSEIDLCAFEYGDFVHQVRSQGKELFLRNLDFSIIPEKDEWKYFDAIEEVLMIGCPNGISDEVNNLPISRRGITATSISKNYNGKPEFMVDMACFPGSSGSPIFLFNRNGYRDLKSNIYHLHAERIKFIGILYSGPLISSDGKIVFSSTPRVEVASMMHLGNAIKTSELHVLDQLVRRTARPRGHATK